MKIQAINQKSIRRNNTTFNGRFLDADALPKMTPAKRKTVIELLNKAARKFGKVGDIALFGDKLRLSKHGLAPTEAEHAISNTDINFNRPVSEIRRLVNEFLAFNKKTGLESKSQYLS